MKKKVVVKSKEVKTAKVIQRYVKADKVKAYEDLGWEVVVAKDKMTARGDLVLMEKAS